MRGCKTDADCDADQYCAKLDKKSDTGVCKTLCEGGKDKNGNKCSAGDSSTPECGYDDKHQSHCSCTPETCPAAYECNHQSNTYYKCEPCAAGEICNCTDGKEANGRGDCVTCNNDNKCAWDEYCANAGTTSSYCGAVSCASDEYVSNHGCHSCGSHCDSCSNSYSCDSCEDGYVDAGDGSCKPQDCGSGYYFDANSNPHCQSCGSNCATCSSSSSCEVCSTGYELVNGECQSISCDAGYYLSGNDCLPCSSECATCSGSASSCDSCDSDYVWTPYTCTLKGCSDMGYQTSCSAGDEETSAGTAPNGELCVSCSTPSTPTSECSSDSDCAWNKYCSASGDCVSISCSGTCKEISNHQCVTKSGCCTGNSDCPYSQICSGNTCVDDTPSTPSTPASCPSGYSTSVMSCDSGYSFETNGTVNGRDCGKCTPKSCPSGYSTSVTSCGSQQALETIGMSGEKDCGKCIDVSCPPSAPAWNGSKCVECTGNIHCPDYKYCKNNVCVLSAGRCETASDCKSSNDGCTGHSCVPLCPAGTCSGKTPKCYIKDHVLVGCECSANSCGDGYECRTKAPLNECVSSGCSSNNDCDSSKKCSGGKCVGACTGVSCSGKTPNAYATNHQCYCECKGSSCGDGYECRTKVPANECVKVGCSSDNDCDSTKKCTNGQCVELCSPNPCSGNTPHCWATGHSYVCECQSGSTAGCPSGQVCVTASPRNKCAVQSNGTVETTEKCETDLDCVAAKRCSKGYCVYRE